MKLYSFEDHPEHEAQLGAWRDKWIANAFSTEPCDWPVAQAAVKGLYRAAKLDPPPDHRIIHVQSPITAAIAGGIAAAVWYLRDHPEVHPTIFGRQISEPELMAAMPVACQVAVTHGMRALEGLPSPSHEVDFEVGAATYDATSTATRNATRNATSEATSAAIDFATDFVTVAASVATEVATIDATEAATSDAIFSATRDATFNATSDATSDAIFNATNNATFNATRDATSNATRNATRNATLDATRNATFNATFSATSNVTLDATRNATRNATFNATRNATSNATFNVTLDATLDATISATRDATISATRNATISATSNATSDATVNAISNVTFSATSGATSDAISTAGITTTGGAIDALTSFYLACVDRWYHFYDGGSDWSWWSARLSFFRHVARLNLPVYEHWQHYETLALQSATRMVHADFCIVSDRQTTSIRDAENRLHCPDGPARTWGDGWAVWYWHGVLVPRTLIEGTWSTSDILREPNVEVRRCAIEHMGWDRFILEAGLAQVGNTQEDPGNPGQTMTLYDVPSQIYDEPVRVLLVTNGSAERDGTRRRFGLTVPADIDIPINAQAWIHTDDDHPVVVTTETYAQLARRC